MSNKSTRIKAGLISNITAKLSANLHIDETGICGGDWADEDDLNRENLNNKQDEQAHSPKLFYPAVALKLEELSGRLQIEHRLAKNEKFQDQQ
ncbi:unnamed protein product [Rotaria sp. Silwood2]|nr:unnamed protein product [Rotaria sp. Silwood2]CAF3123002.1 unnamed protein product [Rotaria sp. Silwood2]CAF4501689.1 unnamed protein product [Rotaria sp. Silwood2]CAF4528353.1 unnamed protein product [Rotaria sp. Silwood2]